VTYQTWFGFLSCEDPRERGEVLETRGSKWRAMELEGIGGGIVRG